jgi:hypothetical protein
MPDRTWLWPAGRAVVLYHWSWFDPALGEIVVGWSQRGEADANGFVHFEAERRVGARSLQVYRDGLPLVASQTFSGLSPLPQALQDRDGTPLPWIRALLGTR